MSEIIKTTNLSKIFFLNKKIDVLKKVNIKINSGNLIALLGPSGSGKSTFLHLLGLLDQPTKGEVYFKGNKISDVNSYEKDKIRSKQVSIIYQQNNLLSDFTSLENVSIAMISSGVRKKIANDKAKEILKKVGLLNRLDHFPSDLSGGEQQRVAIARAVINEPQLILADAPTGSLDQQPAKEIFNQFKKH